MTEVYPIRVLRSVTTRDAQDEHFDAWIDLAIPVGVVLLPPMSIRVSDSDIPTPIAYSIYDHSIAMIVLTTQAVVFESGPLSEIADQYSHHGWTVVDTAEETAKPARMNFLESVRQQIDAEDPLVCPYCHSDNIHAAAEPGLSYCNSCSGGELSDGCFKTDEAIRRSQVEVAGDSPNGEADRFADPVQYCPRCGSTQHEDLTPPQEGKVVCCGCHKVSRIGDLLDEEPVPF